MKTIELKRLINTLIFVNLVTVTSFSQDVCLLELKSTSNDTILVSYFYNPYDSLHYEMTFIQASSLHPKSNLSTIEMKNWIPKNIVSKPSFVNGWIVYIDTVGLKLFNNVLSIGKDKKIAEYKTTVSSRLYSLSSVSFYPFVYSETDLRRLEYSSGEW